MDQEQALAVRRMSLACHSANIPGVVALHVPANEILTPLHNIVSERALHTPKVQVLMHTET